MTYRNLYTNVVTDIVSELKREDGRGRGQSAMPTFMSERDGRKRDEGREAIRTFGRHGPIRPDLWPPAM